MKEKKELLIITGVSGAGKTTAINFFEDRGYLAIDNLPAVLLSKLIEAFSSVKGKARKIAAVVDSRSWANVDEFFKELENLKKSEIYYKILFLDSKTEHIINRYNLTRRKHPIYYHSTLEEKIKEEKKQLEQIKNISNYIVDSSYLTEKELKTQLEKYLTDDRKQLMVTFFSFGFKYGLPIDMDLLFDVRFLPNPYYVEELKKLTGNEKEVSDYVFSFEETNIFYNKLKDMIDFLLPKYIKEGKSHLSVAIACSGGKHRSVSIVNKLYKDYSESNEVEVVKCHRDAKKH
jgi:UPF0042 nucleotide-binding protein